MILDFIILISFIYIVCFILIVYEKKRKSKMTQKEIDLELLSKSWNSYTFTYEEAIHKHALELTMMHRKQNIKH